jgi:hypothetical protein
MIRTSLLVVAMCCWFTTFSGAQNSQLKGLSAISRELSTRLATPGEPIDLGQLLPAGDFAGLLGTWNRFGDEHTFQNGSPNSVNMTIWILIVSKFARELADSCETPRYAFHARFLLTLKTLCKWPAAEARAPGVMKEFWLGLMGYSASDVEYDAWENFFLVSSYRERPARDALEAMTLAIMTNPSFLLRR